MTFASPGELADCFPTGRHDTELLSGLTSVVDSVGLWRSFARPFRACRFGNGGTCAITWPDVCVIYDERVCSSARTILTRIHVPTVPC
jgi:hypothetical protein